MMKFRTQANIMLMVELNSKHEHHKCVSNLFFVLPQSKRAVRTVVILNYYFTITEAWPRVFVSFIEHKLNY